MITCISLSTSEARFYMCATCTAFHAEVSCITRHKMWVKRGRCHGNPSPYKACDVYCIVSAQQSVNHSHTCIRTNMHTHSVALRFMYRVCVCVCVCSGIDGGREKHFTDRDVCRPFLLDICINDLFTNTVSGVCVCVCACACACVCTRIHQLLRH